MLIERKIEIWHINRYANSPSVFARTKVCLFNIRISPDALQNRLQAEPGIVDILNV